MKIKFKFFDEATPYEPRCCCCAGGDKVRAYWRHYFKGSQAVLYVVDAACVQADWAVTHQLFRDTASHPALRGIPWLVLANCQDKRDARSAEQASGRSARGGITAAASVATFSTIVTLKPHHPLFDWLRNCVILNHF